MKKELQILGLTHNESEVYEALVHKGLSKAGALISHLSVHRNIVYECLESLIHKGFVTRISKRGVWWFQITNPDTLLTMVRNKEQVAQSVIDIIRATAQHTLQQITVYEGRDSFRAYWLSTLERFPEGTVDYCLGLPRDGRWEEMMGVRALRTYKNLRTKKKFIWETLVFEVEDCHRDHYEEFPETTEYRILPSAAQLFGNVNIMHDTVMIQDMSDVPRIIEIRDVAVVSIFSALFATVWSIASPVDMNT